MVWILVSGLVAGTIIGCRFEVGAIAAASLIAATTTLAISVYEGASWIAASGTTLALLTALQVGYLVGLVVSGVYLQRSIQLEEAQLKEIRPQRGARAAIQQ